MRIKKTRPGFMLMSALGALLVLSLLLPMLVNIMQRGVIETRKSAVAQHFTVIARAAAKYVQTRHTELLAASTPTDGPAITLEMLRQGDILPDMVADTNAWGQNYQITTRVTPEGDLTAVILTVGGRGHEARDPAFANIIVPETAALAKVGFIPTGLLGSGRVLRGPYASWEIELAGMGLAAEPGHLGMLTSLDSSGLVQDFLYRVAVPGHPELNAMQTVLDMTDHSIQGVHSLQYTPHAYESLTDFCAAPEDEGRTFLDPEKGMYLCRDGEVRVIADTGNSMLTQGATIAANSEFIAKPTCPAGTNTHPEIFLAPMMAAATAAGEEAPAMHATQVWAVDASETEWQVFMRILTSRDEWVYPEGSYGRMAVLTTCVRDDVAP